MTEPDAAHANRPAAAMQTDPTPAREGEIPAPDRAEGGRPDDRFVPIRPAEIIAAIEADAERFGPVAGEIRTIHHWLRRVLCQEGETLQQRLDDRYHPFNPDRDVIVVDEFTPERVRGLEGSLLRDIDYVFNKANFERLGEAMIDEAVRAANTQGLRVRIDPKRIAHLYLYVRGQARSTIRQRSLRAPIRGREREVDLYRRLGVIAQRRDHHALIIKYFRDIPASDLEALLPHARVQMNMFDKMQVAVGGAGALGGLYKAVEAVLTGGLAALAGVLMTVAVALGGLMFKVFFGYRRAKSKRESQRTSNLYSRNLASNASVLHTLVRKIVEEETKEALIACAVLGAPRPTPCFPTDEAVDRACEQWLSERFGVSMNFDCVDAIETIDRLGLWADREARTLAQPHELVERLRDHWQQERSADYHVRCLSRHRFADPAPGTVQHAATPGKRPEPEPDGRAHRSADETA